MPKLLDSLFTQYSFTIQEERGIALVLQSPTFRAYLQTRRAEAAMDKVIDKMDPEQPAAYIQQEAFKAGIINAYDQLLAVSDVELEDEDEESGEVGQESPASDTLGM